MTVGSDTATALYAGASAEGPWLEVYVNGPPWVLTDTYLAYLAGELGVASYTDLWLKGSGESGNSKAQHLGSMIVDRANGWSEDYCTAVEGGPETPE